MVLNLFKKSETDILRKYIKPDSKVLVVGPMGDAGDPTLLILLKVLQHPSKKIVIIDYKDSANSGKLREKDVIPTFGNLDDTRKFLKNLVKEEEDLPHLRLMNALEMDFEENSFDVIIDRVTHQFIFENNRGKEEALIKNYHKTLVPGGRVIFFCADVVENTRNWFLWLVDHLQEKFIVASGKAKKIPVLEVEGKMISRVYKIDEWIVGIKK